MFCLLEPCSFNVLSFASALSQFLSISVTSLRLSGFMALLGRIQRKERHFFDFGPKLLFLTVSADGKQETLIFHCSSFSLKVLFVNCRLYFIADWARTAHSFVSFLVWFIFLCICTQVDTQRTLNSDWEISTGYRPSPVFITGKRHHNSFYKYSIS